VIRFQASFRNVLSSSDIWIIIVFISRLLSKPRGFWCLFQFGTPSQQTEMQRHGTSEMVYANSVKLCHHVSETILSLSLSLMKAQKGSISPKVPGHYPLSKDTSTNKCRNLNKGSALTF
jgi:hypothetical protein